MVSSPEASDKAAMKKRVRLGKYKCFLVDFLLYELITKALVSLRDAKAGLRLCSSQTLEDRVSRAEAHFKTWFVRG